MTKRTILAMALALVTAPVATADFFRGPYDFSLGPYLASPPWSYNVAYGYGLPYGNYQLYNPFDPYQYPGRGAYYPREAFYSEMPYGLEPFTGPRLLFHARNYPPPDGAPIALPPLEPVPIAADHSSVSVLVTVPANAEVWFDGVKTSQSGSDRVFHSPPLQPGIGYMYLVRARWSDGGHQFDQLQTVTVRAGERVQIAFPLPRP